MTSTAEKLGSLLFRVRLECVSDDEERPLQAFLGCAFQFLAMALVSWLFLLGTALLIFQRWCKP